MENSLEKINKGEIFSEMAKNSHILKEYLDSSKKFYDTFGINLSEATYDKEQKSFKFIAKVPENLQAYEGIVHGGTISALLDAATGVIGLIEASKEGKVVFTSRLNIQMLEKLIPEQEYTCQGKVANINGKIINTVGSIEDDSGKLYSKAESVLISKEKVV